MNELLKTWTDSWAANQQALLKSIFPVPPATAGGAKVDSMRPSLDEQFAELRDTWKASIEKWAEFAKEGSKPGALTPEALRELLAPARWSGPGAGAFDYGLRQVLEGPKFATLWDLDRKLLELNQLAVQRDKDVAAYQLIVQKAWNTAFERFSKSLLGTKAQVPDSWRGLTDRWLTVANETLIEVYRSNDFIEAQRRMLRSASDYRLQERRIAEAYCEACHIPTRTEMDEMQRSVTELRRQLRVLQRATRPQRAIDKTQAPQRKRKLRAAGSAARKSTDA